MVIFRHPSEIRTPLTNAVATIGNFDGVHCGHREIFRRVREAAAERGGVSVVITFVPHPLKVLAVGREVRLITTYAEKEALIAACGIDYLVAVPFTPEFAAVSADSFVRDLLVATIGVRHLIIGYDYRFGRNREGSTELLRELGASCGFDVEVLPPLGDGTHMYRSSTVRSLVVAGDVAGVVPLLGRHFSLAGRVVHGHHRGEGLGFPTANLVTEKDLLPREGVYAVKVSLDGELHDGACNIGDNPTFGDGENAIEVFLFDFTGDLYGRDLRVFFVERLRDEQRFPDIALLKEAIAADVARSREILGRLDDHAFRDEV